MKIILHKLLFILHLLISTSLYAQNNYSYKEPFVFDDGWATNNIQSHKIDSQLIYSTLEKLGPEENHNIHSLLLVRNNELILEEYFLHYNPEKIHDLRSGTKSITSLLVGIAVDKGFIESMDDPVFKYLPAERHHNHATTEKSKITIRHLLTMSSGLDCDDWDKSSPGQEDKMYKRKDWIDHVLKLSLINKPGEKNAYCTGGVVLLGEIISEASGLSYDDFAKKYLFDPLQIVNYRWSYFNNNQNVDSGGHLFLAPRDMAKIGQLVLNHGLWKGEKIVSASWIENATTPQANLGGVNYGYLWWNIDLKYGNSYINTIFASGNGGQYIFIIPKLDLVCVFTGGNYNSEKDKLPFYLIQNSILPAMCHNSNSKSNSNRE